MSFYDDKLILFFCFVFISRATDRTTGLYHWDSRFFVNRSNESVATNINFTFYIGIYIGIYYGLSASVQFRNKLFSTRLAGCKTMNPFRDTGNRINEGFVLIVPCFN